MEQKFTLSKSNKIYYGIVAVASLGLFIASDMSHYQLGRLLGLLTAFLLFPSLFAWGVWRFSGKKAGGGNITFHVVLTLLLLGQMNQVVQQKIQQRQQLAEFNANLEAFKKNVSSVETIEESVSAYNKFVDSVKDQLNNLSETSKKESDKQLYKILQEIANEGRTNVSKFQNAFIAIQSPEILDYSLLTNDEIFEDQKNIIQSYLDETKAYYKFFEGVLPNLKKRLRALGEKNKAASYALKGAADRYHLQKPIMEPLVQAYLEYGSILLQMLDFLQKSQGEWAYVDGELLFNKDNIADQYNKLVDKVSKSEETINTLSQKFIDVL